GGDIQDAVKSFITLRNLKDKINSSLSINMTELSMGMSGDYIEAIKEGATIIRVGSAIFGKRDYTNG
ncbi:MAG TPA: YggS family pyridoxal phosphate-dependent enzyme, partial [Spirochaetota bacterium]|nr:YggS family pyridoxal phosphate-dependent enzyme [Spirochaetota bacterium]